LGCTSYILYEHHTTTLQPAQHCKTILTEWFQEKEKTVAKPERNVLALAINEGLAPEFSQHNGFGRNSFHTDNSANFAWYNPMRT